LKRGRGRKKEKKRRKRKQVDPHSRNGYVIQFYPGHEKGGGEKRKRRKRGGKFES